MFDRYAGPLLGYLAGMTGDRSSAEDIVQETMIRVFRNIDRYQERGSFRAWVYRIATNLALTEIRRARFRAPMTPEAVGEIPDGREPSVEESIERSETGRTLRRAIAALPEEQRAVVLLRVRRGLALREIARALSVPEGTVKSRLHHAVRSLRARMNREDAPCTERGKRHDAM
jgi:RNA polymerase sigma-70 factor (ECF subfamily)